MLNLRNQRGSITLFVVTSCMLFISSVVCSQVYLKSKQVAVEREYRQIKSNYSNMLDLDETYTKLCALENNTIDVIKKTTQNGKLVVEFSLSNKNINVNNIKYGWSTSATLNTVTNWSYIENEAFNDTMIATRNSSDSIKNYLHLAINGKEMVYNVTL